VYGGGYQPTGWDAGYIPTGQDAGYQPTGQDAGPHYQTPVPPDAIEGTHEVYVFSLSFRRVLIGVDRLV
jgi:hypothetical protein